VDRTVKLCTVPDEIEANLIKGFLEEEGIPCRLVSQVPPSVYPFTVDGLAEVEIFVRESDLERARSLLEKREDEGNS